MDDLFDLFDLFDPFDLPPSYSYPETAAPPSYDQVVDAGEWHVSSCVPPYISRTFHRHHPYRRILPIHRDYIPPQPMSFPEFYRSLQPSTNHSLNQPASSAVITTITPRALTTPPLPLVERPPTDPAERRRRLIRRVFIHVPECFAIVRAGLGAALRAAEAEAAA